MIEKELSKEKFEELMFKLDLKTKRFLTEFFNCVSVCGPNNPFSYWLKS